MMGRSVVTAALAALGLVAALHAAPGQDDAKERWLAQAATQAPAQAPAPAPAQPPASIPVMVPQAAPAAPVEAPASRSRPDAQGMQTLNLKDADIRVLIGTVSDITGKNFVVDPRVEGKVTVVSSKPMRPSEIYEVFESVLRVHGYAAVPSGSVIKIVPDAVAGQDGSGLGDGASPDSLVTRVIELRHVGATELQPILRAMVPQSSQLAVHQSSNSLVITDRAGNIARIEALLRRIDQAGDAAVEVITLQHANATEMARTLTLLGDDKAAQLNATGAAKVFADARTNSILLSGDKAARLRMRALVAHLDTPIDTGEGTEVIYLHYAKAAELAPILEGVASTLTGQNPASKDQAKSATIQAHVETNALVITADPAIYRALSVIVRKLDVRRLQVHIEAIVAEVSDELAQEVGVQFQNTSVKQIKDAEGNVIGVTDGVIGGTNFNGLNGQGNILGASLNPLSVGQGLAIGYLSGSIKLPGSDTEILQIGALVKALKVDAKNNVLSTPSVVTLDNQEAVIKVGQEVPFLTGSYSNTQTTGGSNQPTNPFQTIERKDVGLQLTVTPHINEGDTVRLDIKQEVSSLAPTTTGAVDLITNRRLITTSVLVKDGTLLVLGGLTSDEVKESLSKVPALGDIPVLGNLFRYRSATKTRRNLLVFLRPTILADAAMDASLSNEKYNYMRLRQLEARENQENLLYPEDHPVVPAEQGPRPGPDAQPRQ